MMTNILLDSIPLWIFYILTVLTMLATMEIGYRLGKSRLRNSIAKPDKGTSGIVAASLALLAFLLAFVVGFEANLFNVRRQFVVDEANAIETAYLRAGYLGEPYKTEFRQLLREYVDVRIDLIDPESRQAANIRAEEIQGELWTIVEILGREESSETTALYIASINEVFDLHTSRINVGIDIRVPPTILIGLYLVAFGSVFLVGMEGAYRESRNLIALILLILILSIAFLLIVDLDRSQSGILMVPQQAIFDLQQKINP